MRALGMAFVAVALLGPAAARAQSVTSQIVGEWHGTSTCVDKARHPACNDEVVIYDVRALARTDSVTLRADKVVNGVRDFMGEFHFGRDSTGTWVADFRNPRVHLRITIVVTGTSMTGQVVDVPSGEVGRRMSLHKIT